MSKINKPNIDDIPFITNFNGLEDTSTEEDPVRIQKNVNKPVPNAAGMEQAEPKPIRTYMIKNETTYQVQPESPQPSEPATPEVPLVKSASPQREVVLVNLKSDPGLTKVIEYVRRRLQQQKDEIDKVSRILIVALSVCESLGGIRSDAQQTLEEYQRRVFKARDPTSGELRLGDLMGGVPCGTPANKGGGLARHRAIAMKAILDRLHVAVNELETGSGEGEDFNKHHAWNSVEVDNVYYIVDLTAEPGMLYRANSVRAEYYKKALLSGFSKDYPQESIRTIGSLDDVAKPRWYISLSQIERVEGKPPLGHGGFGTVYKSMFEGKVVAEKRSHVFTGGAALDFVMETTTMYRLRHPNILSCLGGCIDMGKPPTFVLLAPLMAGGSLRERLRKDPDGHMRKIWISLAQGMARGLAYIHRKGIVHFDFKSPNVMLESKHDFTPKICDFGLAKMRQSSPAGSFVMSAPRAMSPNWAAPEQFSRTSRKTDRIDTYAYGLVVWEIFAGTIPFASIPRDEMRQMKLNQSPPLPIPAHMEGTQMAQQIFQGCCQLNVTSRWTMEEVVDFFEKQVGLYDPKDNVTGNDILVEQYKNMITRLQHKVQEQADLIDGLKRRVMNLKNGNQDTEVSMETRENQQLALVVNPIPDSQMVKKINEAVNTIVEPEPSPTMAPQDEIKLLLNLAMGDYIAHNNVHRRQRFTEMEALPPQIRQVLMANGFKFPIDLQKTALNRICQDLKEPSTSPPSIFCMKGWFRSGKTTTAVISALSNVNFREKSLQVLLLSSCDATIDQSAKIMFALGQSSRLVPYALTSTSGFPRFLERSKNYPHAIVTSPLALAPYFSRDKQDYAHIFKDLQTVIVDDIHEICMNNESLESLVDIFSCFSAGIRKIINAVTFSPDAINFLRLAVFQPVIPLVQGEVKPFPNFDMQYKLVKNYDSELLETLTNTLSHFLKRKRSNPRGSVASGRPSVVGGVLKILLFVHDTTFFHEVVKAVKTFKCRLVAFNPDLTWLEREAAVYQEVRGSDKRKKVQHTVLVAHEYLPGLRRVQANKVIQIGVPADITFPFQIHCARVNPKLKTRAEVISYVKEEDEDLLRQTEQLYHCKYNTINT